MSTDEALSINDNGRFLASWYNVNYDDEMALKSKQRQNSLEEIHSIHITLGDRSIDKFPDRPTKTRSIFLVSSGERCLLFQSDCETDALTGVRVDIDSVNHPFLPLSIAYSDNPVRSAVRRA